MFPSACRTLPRQLPCTLEQWEAGESQDTIQKALTRVRHVLGPAGLTASGSTLSLDPIHVLDPIQIQYMPLSLPVVSSGQGPHRTHFCSLKPAHSNHSNCKQNRSAPVHGSHQHLQAQSPSLGLKQSSSLSPNPEPALSNCLGLPGNESSSHSLPKELGWARYPQAKCARKKWYSTCQRRELPQDAMLL